MEKLTGLNEYQQFTDEVARYSTHVNVIYPVLGLMGEAAEVAEKVNVYIEDALDIEWRRLSGTPNPDHDPNYNNLAALSARLSSAIEHCKNIEKLKKQVRTGEYPLPQISLQLAEGQVDGIASELGDVLFYIARMARSLNLTLADIADKNRVKLQDRVNRGVLFGSGDNR